MYDENQSTADEWKPYSSSFVIRYYDLEMVEIGGYNWKYG